MTREEAEDVCMRQDRCEDCYLHNTIKCVQQDDCEACKIGEKNERSDSEEG